MKKQGNKTKRKTKKHGRIGSGFYSFSLSSYKKNLDNMKLLVSYDVFLKEVAEAREYLKITDDILYGKNHELMKQWDERIVAETDRILDSRDFLDQEKSIRKKLDSQEISQKMAQKQLYLLYNKLPINYLTNISAFLTDKFNLPEHYADCICDYIITNEINAPANNFVIGGDPGSKRFKEMKYVPVKIYARLTEGELRELKRYIDNWIGKRLPKFQILKNIDKKLTIEEWCENRSRYDSAKGTDYEISNVEIAENLLGDKKKGKKVYDINRTIKKLRKNRFGKEWP